MRKNLLFLIDTFPGAATNDALECDPERQRCKIIKLDSSTMKESRYVCSCDQPVATHKIVEAAESLEFHTCRSNHNYVRLWETIS